MDEPDGRRLKMNNGDRLQDSDRMLLADILSAYESGSELPTVAEFRARHEGLRDRIEALGRQGLAVDRGGRLVLTLAGVQACATPAAQRLRARLVELLRALKDAYRAKPGLRLDLSRPAPALSGWSEAELGRLLGFFGEEGAISSWSPDPATGFVRDATLAERVLDIELPFGFVTPIQDDVVDEVRRIRSLRVRGYRALQDVTASFGPLTVIIGANATGKSSVLGALRLLSFAAAALLPPALDPFATPGSEVFHVASGAQFRLSLDAGGQGSALSYEVDVKGPAGSIRVDRERLVWTPKDQDALTLLDFAGGKGSVRDITDVAGQRRSWPLAASELAIRRALDPDLRVLSSIQRWLAGWRFYSGFELAPGLRLPAAMEELPELQADAANLTAVVHDIVLQHHDIRDEIESTLASIVPGFGAFGIKPRGRGQAIVTWREAGATADLTLADLSDGTVRLLAWLALLLGPRIPPLVCIDEPDVGLHPRALAILAAKCQAAAERTQLIITTHSAEFLRHFDLGEIVVMRRDPDGIVFRRPADREGLRKEFEELGSEAIGKMFVSDELEARS